MNDLEFLEQFNRACRNGTCLEWLRRSDLSCVTTATLLQVQAALVEAGDGDPSDALAAVLAWLDGYMHARDERAKAQGGT